MKLVQLIDKIVDLEVLVNKKEYLEFHQKFCQQMILITEKKNADYTGTSMSAFSNFEIAEKLGICSTEQGFMIRISDKIARIISFIQKGELLVKEESVGDTLLDLANYAALLAGYIESKKRNSMNAKQLSLEFLRSESSARVDGKETSFPSHSTANNSMFSLLIESEHTINNEDNDD